MNKAMEGAKRKGREAYLDGRPRRHPYGDLRTHRGGVTFSRAFARYWEEGYDEAVQEGRPAGPEEPATGG